MSTSKHTVRKLGWYQPPHGDPYTRRIPTVAPVESFNTFDEAEMHRRTLEANAREGENPFRFGGGSIFFQSSLDGPRLHDWLMDGGIDPPTSELRHSDWRVWWDAFAHTWSSDQLAHAWAAFDKVRFFEVVEDAAFAAQVVVEIVPERHQRNGSASIERARLVGVYRKAIDYEGRLPRTTLRRARRINTYERLPVPSDVPPFAGVGYLVQRRVVTNPIYRGQRDDPPADVRVPLALFADRQTANEHRDRLAVEGQRTLNPFVFLTEDAAVYSVCDRLAQLGLSLPLPGNNRRSEWLEWYDLCQDEATDEQRDRIWELYDQPLFEVLRVEVRDE